MHDNGALSVTSLAHLAGRSTDPRVTWHAARSSAFALSVLVLQGLVSAHAAGVPVIPGAAGFGVTTKAGRGGGIHRVTNLNESGPGSLAACAEASGPRICIFEVSGTIKLTKNLTVRNPFLTIAGQTAPSPGITLRGAALHVGASDVLVQHIRVRAGDDAQGPDPGNRDSLVIDSLSRPNRITNVVIDHCSFSWSIDETAGAYWYYDNISFLNNIVAQPLHDSIHPKGSHGFGVLWGSDAGGQVSMVGNLISSSVDRNALSRAPVFVFVNNLVYNVGNGVELQNYNGVTSQNAIVGNVFLRGPDSGKNSILLRGENEWTAGMELIAGTKVHVRDNWAEGVTSDPWSIVAVGPGLSRSNIEVGTAPVWPEGLVALKSGDVRQVVLARSGARPADRDSVDSRILSDVKNGTGRIINCVSADGSTRCQLNGGGWPALAHNTRALELPANPSSDDDGDGYTNLEEWLHGYSAQVEGRASELQPLPPGPLRIS